MRKPLYLSGEAEVFADDGPSLVVEQPGRAPGRYPLSRISRIIAAPSVCWQRGSLSACLHGNIFVLILHEKGGVCGLCAGLHGRERPLAEYMENLLNLPDWRERYESWLHAERHRQAAMALDRCRLAASDSRLHRMDDQLCATIRLPRGWMAYLRRHWHGYAVSLALEEIDAVGVSVFEQQRRERGWHLAQDLASCLSWDLLAYLAEGTEHRRWRRVFRSMEGGDLEREVVAAFEQRAPRLRRILRHMMRRFTRWLWEQEPWREPV